MRITSLLSLAASLILAGCTVKDVDAPPFAGPSTLSQSIVMVADRNTLTQNGVDFTDIRITALSAEGQSLNVPLRAQVYVDNIAADFGTLSTKTPTAPTTVRYTAPAASPLAGGQVPTVVTIAVTPANASDFRGEVTRQIDIQLVPQGVIIPTNPNLSARFQVTPASPFAFQTATFDASTSTNNGVACLSACSYAWNFGDGTSGSGITTTHEYRTAGNAVATLTVTDARGAQATSAQTVVVQPPTPPTGALDVTPASPVTGQDVFFSASRSTAATGRRIVSYEWTFGDGSSATGVNVTHRYSTQGNYTVVVKLTDDVGAVTNTTTPVTVTPGGPTVTFTVLPGAPRANQPVVINITATPRGATTIRSYTINWGDGTVETVSTPTQSHNYGAAGVVVISVTATDSLGHQTTVTQSVTIAP